MRSALEYQRQCHALQGKLTHRGVSPGTENNETTTKESVIHKVGNFENNIFHVLVLCPEGT